jgi:hypothetical protein
MQVTRAIMMSVRNFLLVVCAVVFAMMASMPAPSSGRDAVSLARDTAARRLHWYDKEGYEGKKEGYEGKKEGYEGKKEGYEGKKEGYKGKKEGYEGKKEGYEGKKGKDDKKDWY